MKKKILSKGIKYKVQKIKPYKCGLIQFIGVKVYKSSGGHNIQTLTKKQKSLFKPDKRKRLFK